MCSRNNLNILKVYLAHSEQPDFFKNSKHNLQFFTLSKQTSHEASTWNIPLRIKTGETHRPLFTTSQHIHYNRWRYFNLLTIIHGPREQSAPSLQAVNKNKHAHNLHDTPALKIEPNPFLRITIEKRFFKREKDYTAKRT